MTELLKRIFLRIAITWLSSRIDKWNKKIDKAQEKLNKKIKEKTKIDTDEEFDLFNS